MQLTNQFPNKPRHLRRTWDLDMSVFDKANPALPGTFRFGLYLESYFEYRGQKWIAQKCTQQIYCLRSTNKLSLCWKLKQVNLLEMTQKVVSVIEMTFLYAARYWIVLLRQKNEVKLSTQSAPSQICMGKWHISGRAVYFYQVIVLARVPEFFFQTRTVP